MKEENNGHDADLLLLPGAPMRNMPRARTQNCSAQGTSRSSDAQQVRKSNICRQISELHDDLLLSQAFIGKL
jgi:hypothetical protein